MPVHLMCRGLSSLDRNADDSVLQNQDWCHLSAAQKAAAGTLGYTKHIWDRDQITDLSCEDQDWAELTEHQRDACQTLGYNQRVWDAS